MLRLAMRLFTLLLLLPSLSVEATPRDVKFGGLVWLPVTDFTTWVTSERICAEANRDGPNKKFRLPTKQELLDLYQSGKANKAGWILDDTWSSTPYDNSKNPEYWHINLKSGMAMASRPNGPSKQYFTCVRKP